MTKAELAKVIMDNIDTYKKSHLAKMHLADLEKLAAPYLTNATSDKAPADDTASTLMQSVQRAYEENVEMVKGRRLDKDEFRTVAIEKALKRLTGPEDADTVDKVMFSVIKELLENKIAFCPINDTEKRMLETIPQLDTFEGAESEIEGKAFLAKVEELHKVPTATSRALMVALMKKQYYRIIGIKSGQKFTTIQLMERGIRYLSNAGLLNISA